MSAHYGDEALIRQRLRRVFREVLEMDAGAEVDHLTRRYQPWSSLRHISLVVGVEDEFDIDLDGDQLSRLDSFEQALLAVRESLACG